MVPITGSYFHLHLVSDSTGETLITVSRAVAAQYANVTPVEHVYPLVRSQKQLDRVLAEIEEAPGIVLFTLLEKDLVARLEAKCQEINSPSLSIIGPVDDAVTELARARVAVVPLLAGSGTRLKILEAWAAGLPVVSTTIGAEGLPVRHGETVLLADEPRAFADAVTRLLECTSLRRSLGDAGRLLLDKEFTWEKAWGRLDF